MPDREKVIDYLQSEIHRAEQSVNDIWLECVEVKLLRDAMELLKEQDKRINMKQRRIDQLCKQLTELKHKFHEKTELVRCKDCKYNDDGECIIKAGWFPVKPDWFCADSERRDDNA